jgi:hypothetical protein
MTSSTARQRFREMVAQVAEKAKAKLPEQVNGRIESAARLVVNGDVEPLDDGSIKVGGSDPTRWYHLVGPTCTCTDFAQGKAPDGWCKHRIAAGIAKRVQELLPQPEVVTTGDNLPEAPASVNVHLTIDGRQVQLTLRDHDEGRLLERLAAVLQQYPQPQPAPQAASQGQEGYCGVHQVQMKLHANAKGTWYSHYYEGSHW